MRISAVVFTVVFMSSTFAFAEMSQQCLDQRNAEFAELKGQSSKLNKEIDEFTAAVDASNDWTEKQDLKAKLDKLLLEERPKLNAQILEFLKTWKTRPCDDGSNT